MIYQCNSNNNYNPVSSIELVQSYEDKNKEHLLNFTKACWDLYSPRLNNISEEIFNAGKQEYINNNKLIVERILGFSQKFGTPIKVSLSVTSDASLHYTFRFRNGLILFLETFLYLNEENHTYMEVFEYDEIIFSGHEKIENGLAIIQEKLGIRNSNSSLYNSSLFSYSLDCD